MYELLQLSHEKLEYMTRIEVKASVHSGVLLLMITHKQIKRQIFYFFFFEMLPCGPTLLPLMPSANISTTLLPFRSLRCGGGICSSVHLCFICCHLLPLWAHAYVTSPWGHASVLSSRDRITNEICG